MEDNQMITLTWNMNNKLCNRPILVSIEIAATFYSLRAKVFQDLSGYRAEVTPLP